MNKLRLKAHEIIEDNIIIIKNVEYNLICFYLSLMPAK